jgi:NTE family protein
MEIVLALGSGGAKGFAHIGVLQVLEREGFKISALSGTSAGGMTASVYAAGYSADEIAERVLATDPATLFPVHFGNQPAIMGLEGIARVVTDLLGERTFADLAIPCALTAVDLNSGMRVVLQEGRVVDAVLATVAIPGIFPPQKWGTYDLVDGGVLDPVPIRIAREISPDKRLPVVAVVLSKPLDQRLNLPAKKPTLSPTDIPVIRKTIGRLRIAQSLDIFWKSLDIGISASTELRLQVDAPDVIIRPDVAQIYPLGRVNVSEVIRAGQQAAEAALPELLEVASENWQGRFRRWIKREILNLSIGDF